MPQTDSPKFSPNLILIDGSSYLFRAFHALPSLSNASGHPTGAMYGVINMLRGLLEQYQPQQIGVVFDAKGKTFRHEMYPDYKANRPKMPEELRCQIAPLHEIITAMGLPLLIHDGVEADDVIGTLARQADAAGQQTLISTGDKDMAQLVSPHVTLINTMSNEILDRDGVIEKFGVAPERIIDYLALIGDTSDNVPGVPKVGPKTAVKWLAQFGSLVEIMERADEIKGKVGENLQNSLDFLPLSQDLVTIRCDLDLGLEENALIPKTADQDQLRELFTQFEFKKWLAEVSGDKGDHPDASRPPSTGGELKVETIFTEEQLDAWIAEMQAADLFAVDTETTSVDAMAAELVGLSFCVAPGRAAYLPLAHQAQQSSEGEETSPLLLGERGGGRDETEEKETTPTLRATPPKEGNEQQLPMQLVLEKLSPLLEDETPKKIGQNLKYDLNVLKNHDIQLRGIAFDTMLESYVLDSTASRHDMDSLALKYLHHQTISYEEIAGKGKKQLRFDQIPIGQAAPYAAEDAEVTLCLHETLYPQLQEEPVRETLFHDVEMPLLEVLARVERNGVKIDAAMLHQQSAVLTTEIQKIETTAFEEAGEEFNLASPKQIQAILYEKNDLPILKKTPKGQPSTAEPVLQELADDGHILPSLILEHRSLSKLKSTYTDKLPKQINPKTGRVHTSYHQAVAVTGRLSSSDPNLQNIPVRTKAGRRIRQAFVAEAGSVLLAADYSQIELRIMAHLSGDAGLLEAFSEGADIHRATAAEVFGKSLEDVSADQRRSAKAINFGLIYGMSAFGLARQLGITRGAAQKYVDLYFERYPGVKSYMESTQELARECGYVETLFGRRLYLPEIHARNAQRRQYAERTAINAPMQGTAADIIKRAMVDLDRWLLESGFGDDLKMIMQVHDELVFEVREDLVESVKSEIVQRMESAAELNVPLVVDVGVGQNWDEAH